MKFTESNKYCISTDGEFFYEKFDTKEEAIAYIKEEYEEGYVGKIVDIEFTADDFYENLGYKLGEKLYEEIGDEADSWELSGSDEKELCRRMGETMVEFLSTKKLQPSCYKVKHIEKIQK